MFAGDQRPGSPCSSRTGSGLSDEDDDDDDGSCHSSEAPTIQDDDGFEPEQESDNESEDGTPRQRQSNKVQWGPVISLTWVVTIDPCCYAEVKRLVSYSRNINGGCERLTDTVCPPVQGTMNQISVSDIRAHTPLD
jgi:hypothetical protein